MRPISPVQEMSQHGRPNMSTSLTLLLLLFTLLLLQGCVIPRGVTRGRYEFVAGRTNALGQVTEKVLGLPTVHRAIVPIAPDGPEFNYPWRTSWSFVLNDAGGNTKLSFLAVRRSQWQPWEFV